MTKKEEKIYLLNKIKEWEDYNDYPFRNQEDLVECRTNWESLKETALEAYYLLGEIKEFLKK